MKDNLIKQRIVTSVLLSLSLVMTTKPSYGQEAEVDIHSLCGKFPLNSRCKDYEAPVSLKSRPGDKGICSLTVTEKSSNCKFVLTEDKVTLYVEYGRSLEMLEESKATKEYSLPLTGITELNYREFEKRDMGKFLGSSLAFGILPSLLLVQKDHYAELGIVHDSETLTLVLDRDLGIDVRGKLERYTEIVTNILEEESPELEEENQVSNEQKVAEPRDLVKFCESYPFNSRCKNNEE